MNNKGIKNILSEDELDNIVGGTGDNSSKFEEIDGTVIEVLPNAGFKVQLDNGEEVKPIIEKKKKKKIEVED